MSVIDRIVHEVRKVFVGDEKIIRKVVITLLAGGHLLLEDIPGVGKTTLAVTFSKVLGLTCNRIQFTPDVMPTDVTGFTMLHKDTYRMEYQPGAIMCNLLLADEINRASTRSQSALLQAMEENAVTIDGTTHRLPQPFMVLATQNPAGSAGTQLLPESQTDRFMMRMSIGYPDEDAEMEMILRRHGDRDEAVIEKVVDAEVLLEMRRAAAATYIDRDIYRYILQLSRSTREHEKIIQGASPRCTVALTALSQAQAFISGRDYVIPEDVQSVYVSCTAHRLILSPQAKREGITPEKILCGILSTTRVPRLKVR